MQKSTDFICCTNITLYTTNKISSLHNSKMKVIIFEVLSIYNLVKKKIRWYNKKIFEAPLRACKGYGLLWQRMVTGTGPPSSSTAPGPFSCWARDTCALHIGCPHSCSGWKHPWAMGLQQHTLWMRTAWAQGLETCPSPTARQWQSFESRSV